MAKTNVATLLQNEKQTRSVPPDPEKMNDERAEWANAAIETFIEQTNVDEEDAVNDLLCDIAHWCDREGYQFSAILKRAEFHYDEETSGKGKQFLGINFG